MLRIFWLMNTRVTLETAINQCLKAHKEALLELDDPKSMGAVVAYVRSLSEGQKIAVRVPAAADASSSRVNVDRNISPLSARTS